MLTRNQLHLPDSVQARANQVCGGCLSCTLSYCKYFLYESAVHNCVTNEGVTLRLNEAKVIINDLLHFCLYRLDFFQWTVRQFVSKPSLRMR